MFLGDALVQLQLRTNNDYRTTVVDSLRRVQAEAALLPFQHVGQRLRARLPSARTAFCLTRVVRQRGVNSFLQHALLVPQNHFRADFNQALEAGCCG
jgi:hypothetical protein